MRILILVLIALLAAPGPLFAAKGIIKGGGGGMSGLILVSDTDGYGGTDTAAGELVSFTESNSFPVGSAVTFDIVASSAATAINIRLDPEIVGIAITQSQSGNLTINANQSYLVTDGARLSGNITVDGGKLYVTGGSSLNGNLKISSNAFIVCDDGSTVSGSNFEVSGGGTNTFLKISSCTVNGKFSSSGITKIKLIGNSLNGNITSQGDGAVTITRNSINGNLTVSGAGTCNVSGNTVSGTTTLDPICH